MDAAVSDPRRSERGLITSFRSIVPQVPSRRASGLGRGASSECCGSGCSENETLSWCSSLDKSVMIDVIAGRSFERSTLEWLARHFATPSSARSLNRYSGSLTVLLGLLVLQGWIAKTIWT